MSIFFERLSNMCNKLLLRNDNLIGYLCEKRGITKDTIQTYKLGAFPDDLRDLYTPNGIMNAEELVQNGIIWNAERSPFKRYPLVIPINDIARNPIRL